MDSVSIMLPLAAHVDGSLCAGCGVDLTCVAASIHVLVRDKPVEEGRFRGR